MPIMNYIIWQDSEKLDPEINKTVLVSGGLARLNNDNVWISMTGHDTNRVIQWNVDYWADIPLVPHKEK